MSMGRHGTSSGASPDEEATDTEVVCDLTGKPCHSPALCRSWSQRCQPLVSRESASRDKQEG